jgi:hypothetical protein
VTIGSNCQVKEEAALVDGARSGRPSCVAIFWLRPGLRWQLIWRSFSPGTIHFGVVLAGRTHARCPSRCTCADLRADQRGHLLDIRPCRDRGGVERLMLMQKEIVVGLTAGGVKVG